MMYTAQQRAWRCVGSYKGLHNVEGRMGEFRLLYLLCMLRFPVPLHSLQIPEGLADRHRALAAQHAAFEPSLLLPAAQ
jgi:hypothetical protein